MSYTDFDIIGFEYKVRVTFCNTSDAGYLEKELNSFGDDGWELAHIIPDGGSSAIVVFKRPKFKGFKKDE